MLRGTRAVLVDGPRDELLPGAALAGDEDRGGRRAHLPQDLEQPLHLRRAAEDALEAEALVDLALELDVVPAQPARLDGHGDARTHLGDVDGLRQVVGGTVAE